MKIKVHQIKQLEIAEVMSDSLVIDSADTGSDLVASLYFGGYDKVILHQKNICDDFFNLKTKIAGEVLQKFSNFRVQLVIVGDFKGIQSKSMTDFMYESNSGSQINFLDSVESAKKSFSK